MSGTTVAQRPATGLQLARVTKADLPQASPKSLNDAVLGLLGMTWPAAPSTPAQGDETNVAASALASAAAAAPADAPRSRSRSLKRDHGTTSARYSSPPGDMPGPREGGEGDALKPEIRARRGAWPRESARSESPRATSAASASDARNATRNAPDGAACGSSPVEAMLLAAQRAARGDVALDAAKTPAGAAAGPSRSHKSTTPRSRGHTRTRVRVRTSRRAGPASSASGRARGGTPTHKSTSAPRAGSATGSPSASSAASGSQDTIIGRSRTHWLTNDDIYELLCNFEDHGLSVRERPAQNPPSGSLFVYNRLVTKHYRDDGVPLRKRPDRSNSAKECHMKLKLQDRYVMNAVYASCLPDDDGTCFSRRVYSRLDDPSWPYVLVHYLQAGNTRVYAWNGSTKKRAASRRGSRSRASGRATKKPRRTRRRSPSSGSTASKKSEGASSLDDAASGTTRSTRASRSPRRRATKSKRSRATALRASVTTPAASPTSGVPMPQDESPVLAAQPNPVNSMDAGAGGATEPAAPAASAAGFGAQMATHGAAQVPPLASMMSHHMYLHHQLQQQLHAEKSLGLSQQLFQSMNQLPSLLRHVDIAPSMASTVGGCIVVTRLMGNSVLLDMLRLPGARLQCQFGMVVVPAVCSEPGVVQCVAPQHAAGVVPFSVRLHGANVSLAISFSFLPGAHVGPMNPMSGASMSYTPTTTATSMSVLSPNAQHMAQVHAQALARAHAQAQQAAQASAASSALRHQIILRQ